MFGRINYFELSLQKISLSKRVFIYIARVMDYGKKDVYFYHETRYQLLISTFLRSLEF